MPDRNRDRRPSGRMVIKSMAIFTKGYRGEMEEEIVVKPGLGLVHVGIVGELHGNRQMISRREPLLVALGTIGESLAMVRTGNLPTLGRVRLGETSQHEGEREGEEQSLHTLI